MADNRTLAKGAMIGGAPIYYTEESTTGTTMPSTSFFKTEDVDGKPVKISRDNIMGIVKECLGTILNGGSDQTTVTKVPTLNGNTLGASAVSTLASVLGVGLSVKSETSGYSPTPNQDPVFRYQKGDLFCDVCFTSTKHILVRFGPNDTFQQIV